MSVSYQMLTINWVYFHKLSNELNIARKLYDKMSHALRNIEMAVSYLMLTIRLIYFPQLSLFEYIKKTISINVTSFKKYENGRFLPNVYY